MLTSTHEIEKINKNEYSSLIKINNDYLCNYEKNIELKEILGDWIYNIKDLRERFTNAKPFSHIVIDNFLNHAYAANIENNLPRTTEGFFEYNNPLEVKYTYDNIDELHESVKNYFYLLSCKKFVKLVTSITSINDLEIDEYLHGAGVHYQPKYGRLQTHLDYEKHPYSGKERKLNIIYMLTKDWDPSWNGANELWDEELKNCVQKTEFKFNRAIIFKTNDISWHGVPEIIKCPENVFRKSLAYYYIGDLEKDKNIYRNKANYKVNDNNLLTTYSDNINELCKIRSIRRLEKRDIERLYSNWSKDKES